MADFLKTGFGTNTKRQVDLKIFHLLSQYGKISSLSNYELSNTLKITESKIKSLKYESQLIHGPISKSYMHESILKSISQCDYDYGTKRLRMSVEDPFVLNFLQGVAKKADGIPDNSFNSEIINMEKEAFVEMVL